MEQESDGEKDEPGSFGYTAFEKWDYKQIVYENENKASWISLSETMYRASLHLIEGVVNRGLNADVEGVAGIQLFRHYLELALKRTVLWGRMLKDANRNAIRAEVNEVAHIHDLAKLWDWVIRDAKPKILQEDWNNYDIDYVERCIKEFDTVDKKGFTFRYHGYGIENLCFDFNQLATVMEHIYQVIEGIETYLVETHGENEEWESILADF